MIDCASSFGSSWSFEFVMSQFSTSLDSLATSTRCVSLQRIHMPSRHRHRRGTNRMVRAPGFNPRSARSEYDPKASLTHGDLYLSRTFSIESSDAATSVPPSLSDSAIWDPPSWTNDGERVFWYLFTCSQSLLPLVLSIMQWSGSPAIASVFFRRRRFLQALER